jgi:hypothetical protein
MHGQRHARRASSLSRMPPPTGLPDPAFAVQDGTETDTGARPHRPRWPGRAARLRVGDDWAGAATRGPRLPPHCLRKNTRQDTRGDGSSSTTDVQRARSPELSRPTINKTGTILNSHPNGRPRLNFPCGCFAFREGCWHPPGDHPSVPVQVGRVHDREPKRLL